MLLKKMMQLNLFQMLCLEEVIERYSCSPVALFDVQVEKYCPQDFIDIKRTLEREIRGCQKLIIWTDGDREGENIGFEIIQVCKAIKPNIPVLRARFSEITPQAVMRACRNLVPPDKNTSDAVDVRMELDLRIGAAFTRFQTLRLQKIFPDVLSDQLISYGSCQFPTLGFVVERYKQVQRFVPEPFWKLKVSHKRDEDMVDFNWKRNRLFDNRACLVLYEHCIEVSQINYIVVSSCLYAVYFRNPIAKVLDVKSKSKSKWRPQPLDTVELEKLASRKLKINAKETMKIAEKLYTQGFISYPRTETNIFPKDLDLRGLIEQQTRDENWGDFAAGVLEHGPHPRNGNKSDQAHPPIHPTKYTNNLQFTAQGLMIIARNYLDVYPYDKWNAKVIPVYHEGDTFQPNSIEMAEGETSPPSLLTEADLIALMEKHGIGTDATHAEHIETIKSRMYVGVRPDGKFVPGQLGMGLVEGYDAMGYEMSKPNLRAELEADLKRICEGTKNKNDVLQEQVQKYKQVFIEACRQAIKIDEALSQYLGEARELPVEEVLEVMASVPVKKCPNCSQDMYYIGCMGYPDCKNAIWFPDWVLEATGDESHCQQCQSRQIKFKFKKGHVPPMMPLEYTGCIGGCDDLLSEALGLNRQKSGFSSSQRPRQVTNNSQNTPANNSYNSRSNSSDNNRQMTVGANRNQSSNYHTASSHNNSGNMYQGFQNSFNSPNSVQNRSRGQSSPRVPLMSVEPFNRGSDSTGGDSGRGGDENAIVCNCGDDAIQLTVRKEGPNTGRQFYKCGSSKCNFFLWADEAGSGGGGGAPVGGRGRGRGMSNSYSNSGNRVGYSRSDSGGGSGFSGQRNYSAGVSNSSDMGPNCNCGELSKCLTVQKEGPNKGRQFHTCSKPRGEGCNFFQWADENDSSGGTTGSGWGQRGGTRGGGRGGRGGGVAKRNVSSDDASGPATKNQENVDYVEEKVNSYFYIPINIKPCNG
ncbi:hypothetical protein KUTeg_004104 [Tegillarca granosa]|uniref:DNA topoisomerase n=1 Tax=Tegillarca granosa TaxID=220873 RepID=A0ABQ9FP39_TEGGR|nr:hypothetical protein KUTeg_004104 [Tegillarca granosa]